MTQECPELINSDQASQPTFALVLDLAPNELPKNCTQARRASPS